MGGLFNCKKCGAGVPFRKLFDGRKYVVTKICSKGRHKWEKPFPDKFKSLYKCERCKVFGRREDDGKMVVVPCIEKCCKMAARELNKAGRPVCEEHREAVAI